jgi:hypothetical protein
MSKKRRTKKDIIISKIKKIIEDGGGFSVADVEHESSPVIASIGKDTFQLAERFGETGVEAITYVHETVVNEDDIEYEDLSVGVLEEILNIVENYQLDFEKNMERCRD